MDSIASGAAGSSSGAVVSIGEILSRPNAYQVAQACAALGWRVLPLRRDTKKPSLKRWTELATTDLDAIDEWWCGGQYSGCLCGVATGAASDLWVLDVDCHDVDGFGTLAGLEAEYGALPHTFTVETPSGGRHYYWRWPDGSRADAVLSRNYAPGLDAKGRGGQVVAPGTWLVDRHYRPRDALIEIPLPYAPDWLVEWMSERRVKHHDADRAGRDHRTSAERDAEWVLDAANVNVGGRHDYLFRGMCSMRARDVDPAEMRRLALDAAARFPVGGRVITEEDTLSQVADVIGRYPSGRGTDIRNVMNPIKERYLRWLNTSA
jgi:hypothetical protein